MARRVELTPELVSQITTEVARAHYPAVVARRLGVTKQTFEGWMERGEKAHQEDWGLGPDDSEFLPRCLFEGIEEAEAQAEIDLVNQAHQLAGAGRSSWQGMMTIAERRFSDRWRKRDVLAADVGESLESRLRKELSEREVEARREQAAPGSKLRLIDEGA